MMTIKSRGPVVHQGGSYNTGGAVMSGPVSYYGKQWTDSVNSPGPPYVKRNPFITEKLTGRPGKVSLDKYWDASKQLRAWYRDYSMIAGIGQSSSPQISHWPIPVPQINEVWVTTALSRVNFTKPVISLPNFIFELREFPRMLQELGRVLDGGSRISDVPGAYLAWQFGWGPLLSDIKTMLQLGVELEAQRKRFLKAQSERILQGSILEDESTFSTLVSANVVGVSSYRRYWTVKHDVWYTAHFDLDKDLRPPELFGNAWQTAFNALGLNRPAATIWNAIPWSFIIDYFTNVSTWLEVTGGYAKYRPSEICIMYTAEAEMTNEEVTFESLTGGTRFVPGAYKIVRKIRAVRSHPTPRIYLDTWGFEQRLPILANLSLAKFIRGARG